MVTGRPSERVPRPFSWVSSVFGGGVSSGTPVLVYGRPGRDPVEYRGRSSRRPPQTPLRSGHRLGCEQLQEAHEHAAVATKRRHADVLVRAVVAPARRAELDARDAAVEEEDGVGGAVAADHERLPRRTVRER